MEARLSEVAVPAGQGHVTTWAIDAIVHQQRHLLNDRLLIQLVSETFTAREPVKQSERMADHFLGEPVPLVERSCTAGRFHCAPVTFTSFGGNAHATAALVYWPVRGLDGITVAFFRGFTLRPHSGPYRFIWPDGVFDV